MCVTIYSFRHSGAIEIFKRTGSLTKLQRAMGHSSLNVSLTYLRGLEVAELKEEDIWFSWDFVVCSFFVLYMLSLSRFLILYTFLGQSFFLVN